MLNALQKMKDMNKDKDKGSMNALQKMKDRGSMNESSMSLVQNDNFDLQVGRAAKIINTIYTPATIVAATTNANAGERHRCYGRCCRCNCHHRRNHHHRNHRQPPDHQHHGHKSPSPHFTISGGADDRSGW